MSKNNIIGLVVIVGLLIGYSLWMTPSKEEMAAARRKSDSISQVQRSDSLGTAMAEIVKKAVADSIAKTNPVAQIVTASDTISKGFASVSKNVEKFYTLESDLLKLKISSQGGRIWSVELKDYKTADSLPLVLFKGDSSVFGFEFNTEDLRTLNTADLMFVQVGLAGKDSIRVSGKDSLQFALRVYPGKVDTATSKSYIEYVYTLKGNDYMIGYKVNFVGMKGYIAQNTRDMSLLWGTTLLQQEKSIKTEQAQSTIYYMDASGEVNNLKETKDSKERISTPVKWVSFKQQFFSSTLIADDKFESADLETAGFPNDNIDRHIKTMNSAFILPFTTESNQTYNLKWYFGPNKYKVLRKYKLNLERQIPLGWGFFLMQWINRFAVIPVFNWLESSNLNYGIIILILTILLKIVLFPIAYKTYISSAKMRILKPEIEEIGLKFPKKDDAMKKQSATMALYKKAGVNPMAGCIPMLLQFPILIALFRFFPAAFELRQQSFLWATDLSSYDSIYSWTTQIPLLSTFYGNHISLFTLLMTVSTIMYTKMNNDMMGSTQQMPGMKTMMYLMPIMFLGFFNNYSAGLSYYYMLANLFTFAQMFLIRRFVNEDKLHARIQANKSKTVKKSSFQKRLEDMTKQQQQKAVVKRK
ncbi:MAG: membrane protein insertase YidC [Lentimicrobiaceae bacterium]|jgi:YidC/Oxa1 family membrane protein insertase